MTTKDRKAIIEATTMITSGRSAGASAAVFSAAMDRAAVAEVKASAAIPSRCGPDIAPAPARGAFTIFTPREMVPGSSLRIRHAGYAGRDAVRVADAFDRMEADARRAWSRVAEQERGQYQPPFTVGQITIGRHYQALTERHEGGGVRCVSLEASRGGGGSGAFIDAFIDEARQLHFLHCQIGRGVALHVRRPRAQSTGRTRSVIKVRRLVDMVCLHGHTLPDVLRAHGWAKDGRLVVDLRLALAAALDRMQGYTSPHHNG